MQQALQIRVRSAISPEELRSWQSYATACQYTYNSEEQKRLDFSSDEVELILRCGFLGRARTAVVTPAPVTPAPPEPLSFEEAQKTVQFEVDGQVLRVNINDELDVCSKEDFPEEEKQEPKMDNPG